jgi:hypothetical protein
LGRISNADKSSPSADAAGMLRPPLFSLKPKTC